MVARVPVTVPVGGDTPGEGLVVTLAQFGQQFRIELIDASGTSLVNGFGGILQGP
ncbi:MAG: hypothetical protein M3460_19790 [Actinomycetota bacterium]|nr:hypothetical protein [Actinomycetota bacterium]